MEVNERVMSQTDNLGSMDFDNPALRELVERQMSSMSAMRSLMSLEGPDAPRKPFSGWKVKIESVRCKLFRDTVAVNNIHHSTNP